jgi:hypothetical protein
MKKRLFLIVGVLIAFSIFAITFATTSQSTNVSITAGSGPVTVTEAVYKPSWSPAKNTLGTTGSGDLFTLTKNTTEDIWVTLYLTNSADLSKAYSYLNLNVTTPEGSKVLTLTNGYISFKFTGAANSSTAISLNSGSYYSIETSNVVYLSPAFYIEAR